MAHLIDAIWEELGEDLEEDVNDADYLSDSEDASEPANAYDPDETAPAQGNSRDTALVPFDPALAALHTYLGDCTDLHISDAVLEDGHVCRLPVLTFPDVVLMPGATLPLLVQASRARWVVEHALAAPSPHTCLIAVVFREMAAAHTSAVGAVGCTALLRKLLREEDGGGAWPVRLKVLAEGCQRFEVVSHPGTELRWNVRILADSPTPRVPVQAQQGAAAWAPWAWAQSDAWALAEAARALFAETAPEIRVLQGDPVAVSYWLARNTPGDCRMRQALLQEPSPARRLRAIIAALSKDGGGRLLCRGCRREVGRTRDALRMSDEGAGGIFVNSAGYVHDLVALRAVRAGCLALQGAETLEHSWFPGYAWTIACCSACGSHLGWRFSSVRGQAPGSFYGLRRQTLLTRAVGHTHAGARHRL